MAIGTHNLIDILKIIFYVLFESIVIINLETTMKKSIVLTGAVALVVSSVTFAGNLSSGKSSLMKAQPAVQDTVPSCGACGSCGGCSGCGGCGGCSGTTSGSCGGDED